MTGFVSLVGAGPGDPDLLTVKAARRLAEADVPYEIVPGISSAIAAPALAGIPVTHRGIASGFAVLSGHDESAWGPMVDAIPPEAMTLVVLMGLRARAAIATRLLRRGWPRATPAAALIAASTPRSAAWVGALSELGAATLPEAGNGPGTLVVGRVASLAASIGTTTRTEIEAIHAVAPVRARGA